MKNLMVLPLIIFLTGTAFAQTPSGEEILKRVDNNLVIDRALAAAEGGAVRQERQAPQDHGDERGF